MEWSRAFNEDEYEVKVAELLVATADTADYLIDGSVSKVLRLLRETLQMDVVFVSEFTGGQRVFRAVDEAANSETLSPGGSDPLESSWCQRVVDGRLPELIQDAGPLQASGQAPAAGIPIGTHLSTPIVLKSGEVYGTLCCFSFGVNPGTTQKDLQRLRYTAQLTAMKIDHSRNAAANLQLERSPVNEWRGRI